MVEDAERRERGHEFVRCLACRAVYENTGAAERAESGCPECGHVGWLSVLIPPADPAPSPGVPRSA